MAVEINSVRARLVPSTRFLLALLICFGFFVQFAQRINLSIAIVCMVNKTGLNLPSESKNNIISNNSRTIPRTTLFFQEQQFLWSEWHQQIILGSYWGGYLFTLVPSKN
jgi:ACS family sodium-dependent inorganic phosphate cotransporter-like MFS transporter 5